MATPTDREAKVLAGLIESQTPEVIAEALRKVSGETMNLIAACAEYWANADAYGEAEAGHPAQGDPCVICHQPAGNSPHYR